MLFHHLLGRVSTPNLIPPTVSLTRQTQPPDISARLRVLLTQQASSSRRKGLQEHPDRTRDIQQQRWPYPAPLDRTKPEPFAAPMPQSGGEGTQSHYVGVPTADMICGVRTQDALEESPGAKSASRKSSDQSRIAGVDGSGHVGGDVSLDSVEDGEGGHLRGIFQPLSCEMRSYHKNIYK